MQDNKPTHKTELPHQSNTEANQMQSSVADSNDKTYTKEEIKENVILMLKKVYDPEIPVNVYDLGLIYEVQVKDDNSVHVVMTLTSPNCPVAETLPLDVEAYAESAAGVFQASVEVTFDPPWTPDNMTEAAKLELNLL